jgi:hypothetical protein
MVVLRISSHKRVRSVIEEDDGVKLVLADDGVRVDRDGDRGPDWWAGGVRPASFGWAAARTAGAG